VRRLALIFAIPILVAGCRRDASRPHDRAPALNLLIVTIDTLRADRVGAYGYKAGRTPNIDALAAKGARFTHAYSSAPITLTSHATLMTGRYPPGHGARHNGMRLDASTPTIADTLARAGFNTAAFVGAFPLDHRFGLDKGFRVYGDRMPRSPQGRLASERPGRQVVDEAISWLNANRGSRFFLWVHLFEPHAPYGDPSDQRPVQVRYDDEVSEADRQTGRVIDALGPMSASTLIVVASDHGEAFGEHGEISHSIFVYDTTLRVPLVIAGPEIPARTIDASVGLVDVPPTLLALLGIGGFDADGLDLSPALDGRPLRARDLYAESFAPLLDFGWSPLRSIRSEGFKYIEAPKPELYRVESDAAENENVVQREPQRAASLSERAQRISPASLTSTPTADPEAAARLQSLGYVSGRSTGVSRSDPKDRRELAARIAQVTSGELQGAALERTLEEILTEDPRNSQAHLRLGYVQLESNRCAGAVQHFRAAIAEHMPTADAHLGLASCQATAHKFDDAMTTLKDAERIEPQNPVVVANRGVVLSDAGRLADAIPFLQRALALDADFHQARFNLALAYARSGQRADAAREASELLRRLPAGAPQRPEVERLLAAVSPPSSAK
jgi:choline-sulfatase